MSLKESLEIRSSISEEDFGSMPSVPKKPFCFALGLLVAGLVLLVVGFVQEVHGSDHSRGIAFLAMSALVTLPGAYYSFQFYKAHRAKNPLARMKALKNIPEM